MFPKTSLLSTFGFLLLTAAVTGAAPLPAPRLVKDIATGNAPVQYSTSEAQQVAAVGNRVFFTQIRADTGEELWVSDGTSQSSRLLKDIRPGITSSEIREMVISGSQLFFTANDGVHGRELWTSDGTETGTRQVQDLAADPHRPSGPHHLHPFKGGVAFALDDEDGLPALGWTDGTAANTRLLKTLVINKTSRSYFLSLSQWGDDGDYFYFGAQEGSNGQDTALWRTDGTVAGTTQVKLFPNNVRAPLVAGHIGHSLYFGVKRPGSPADLWKTDGTEAGTVFITTLTGGHPPDTLPPLQTIGHKGYIGGGFYGLDVWEIDDTAGTSRRILESNYRINQVIAIGTRLWISTREAPSQIRLLDPDTLTTTEVSSSGSDAQWAVGDGKQIWYSRSMGGIARICIFNGQKEIAVPVTGFYGFRTSLTAQAFFASGQDMDGKPWVWKVPNKAPFTPVRLSPERVLPASSNPREFAQVSSGWQVFCATTPGQGDELWATDGTPAGTQLVKDIFPGKNSSQPRYMRTGPGGFVFFLADNAQGTGLWKTNGTAAGTTRVSLLSSLYGTSWSGNVLQFGSRLIFECGGAILATQGAPGAGLETLQGENGRLIPILNHEGRVPRWLAAVMGDSLYFIAEGTQSSALYRARELENGELEVTRLDNGYREISDLLVASTPGGADQLYFIAKKGGIPNEGNQVYRCDGVHVSVLLTLERSAEPEKLSLGGGRLIVETDPESNDAQLWVPSTTEDKLTLLTPGNFLGGTADAIYFWEVNPFESESIKVSCIRPDGSGKTFLMTVPRMFSFYDAQILSRDGQLVFAVNLEEQPLREVWISQGTPETTRQVPGLILRDETHAFLQGDTLYLGAHAEGATGATALGQELYAFDLPVSGLNLTQIIGEGPARPLKDGDTLDPFIQAVGQSRTVTLQITNNTPRTVTNLNLSAPVPALADFTFDVTSLGDLAPGQTAQVQITFTPAAPGLQEGEFTVSASGMPDLELDLTGAGLGGDAPPAIGHLPPLILAAIGDTLTLKPEYVVPGASPSFRWRNSGKPAGTGEELHVAPVISSSFGSYTLGVSNAHGFAESTPVQVAVLLPLRPSHRIAEGKTLTLTCATVGPKDSTFSYQWLRDGVPLADYDRVRGSQTRELTLADIKAGDARTYACLVTFTYDGQSVSRSSGETEVEVMTKPEWVAFDTSLNDFGYCFIGQQVTRHEVEFLNANEVTVKGLPPGLTWRESTSSVIGRATKAGVFNVTFTATNSAGVTTKTLTIQVLPAMKPGGYDGLLDRVAISESNPGLGSRVLFTVAPAGTLSGQLFHEGKVYRFAGMPATLPGEPEANRTLPVSIPVSRGKNQPGITLTFRTGSTQSSFTLSDALTGTDLTGDLKPAAVFSAEEAAVYPGLGCILLKGEGGGMPGTGYLTTVVSKTGRVTWKGKLADGTAITGSSSLCRALENSTLLFGVHLDLYKATGSAHGWIRMNAMNMQRPLLIDGALTWNKLPQPPASKDRVYKEGIPLHTLGTGGGSYTPPPKGEFILNLPPMENETVHAEGRATLQADSIPTEGGLLSQTFKVTLKHTANLTFAGPGAFLTGLTFNAAQGTFKGTLKIAHPNPKLDRTATFEGVMEPAVTHESAGFFLLPDLPADGQPVSALKTTPLRSGLIQITQDD